MEIPEVDFSDKNINLGKFLSKLLGVMLFKGLMSREDINQIATESEQESKPVDVKN